MKNKIIIIDAIMGKGKSTYVINEIIKKHPEKKFICVVPTVDKLDKNKNVIKEGEVGRYLREIGAEFYEPETKPSKTKDLQRLISKDSNIVTTHALIQNIDEITIDLLKKSNYTLIIDECLSVVQEYGKNGEKCSQSDVKTLLHDEWVKSDERGFLVWNTEKEKTVFDNKYRGRWDDIKRLCNLHALMRMPRPGREYSDSIFIWNLPVEFFTLFSECYICTYLWNGSFQKSYFDMHNVVYYHMTLNDNGSSLDEYDIQKEQLFRMKYYSLINICRDDKLNAIGTPEIKGKKHKNPLCKNWYLSEQKEKQKNADKKSVYLERLKHNTINYFKNIVRTKSDKNMYTTFKDYRNDIKGEGYTRGFVYCNCKGTNEYRHKESLAYLINLFPPKNIVRFFEYQGIKFDVDMYALSELLQWIWRSRIRDGYPINLYIPSQRMRTLLDDWAHCRI